MPILIYYCHLLSKALSEAFSDALSEDFSRVQLRKFSKNGKIFFCLKLHNLARKSKIIEKKIFFFQPVSELDLEFLRTKR